MYIKFLAFWKRRDEGQSWFNSKIIDRKKRGYLNA